MVVRTSLRKIAMSRGASMPIFTISPSMREMRISIESPMMIDSLTLRERTSMVVSGCAGDRGRLRVFDEGVLRAVARVVGNDQLTAHPGAPVDHDGPDQIHG